MDSLSHTFSVTATAMEDEMWKYVKIHIPMAPSSVVYILDFNLLTLFLLLPTASSALFFPSSLFGILSADSSEYIVFQKGQKPEIPSSSLDMVFCIRFLFLCSGAWCTAVGVNFKDTHHNIIPSAELSAAFFPWVTFMLVESFGKSVRNSMHIYLVFGLGAAGTTDSPPLSELSAWICTS